MRKIEQTMLKCVFSFTARTLGNTKVFVSPFSCWGSVVLFGNTIAHWDDNLILTLIDGGHRTATTKSRLNALLNNTGYRVCSSKGEWRLSYRGQDRGPFENYTNFYIGGES